MVSDKRVYRNRAVLIMARKHIMPNFMGNRESLAALGTNTLFHCDDPARNTLGTNQQSFACVKFFLCHSQLQRTRNLVNICYSRDVQTLQ